MAIIRKFSRRERGIAAVVALFAAAALFYNAAIEPLAVRRRQLDAEIEKKTSDLKKGMRSFSQKAGGPDYAGSLAYTGAGKSEEADISDTLALIEHVSRENSCLIVSIRPGSAKVSGRLKEITVDLDIEAPLEPLSKFLYDVENRTDMAIRINRFMINAAMGPGGTLKCALSISRISAG